VKNYNSHGDKDSWIKNITLILFFAIILGGFIILMSVNYHPEQDIPTDSMVMGKTLQPLSELPKRKNMQEILFGCSISKQGKFINEGQCVIEGYNLWVETINQKGGLIVGNNKYPVRIIYYDDESKKEKVRENILKLINEDKVDFLLGPFSSSLTLVASQIAEKHGKILLDTCGASEIIFSQDTRFTFAALTSSSWYTRDFFQMMSQKIPKQSTFAVLANNNLFSKSVAKGARIWGTKAGFKEKYYKIQNAGSESWISLLEELNDKSPDILVFAGHYKDAVNFIEQLNLIDDYHPKPAEKKYITI
jgi:branched-chain amino acid transport system substrate-binding protein